MNLCKSSILVGAFFLGVAFCSCSEKDERILEDSFKGETQSSSVINQFKSRADLRYAVENISELRSLMSYRDNGANTDLENLIPNDALRRLVTLKGEIIVGDTLYRVTEDGTFFTHTRYADELSQFVERGDIHSMNSVSDSLCRLNNVSLYKTFGDRAASESDKSTPNDLRLASPDISKFPVKNMDRITIVGKMIQNLFGTKKDGEESLKSIRGRRICGSLYSYDYVFYREMGLMSQVEKKMWHGGWGRVENWDQGTTIGYNGLIVREERKDLADLWKDSFFGTWEEMKMQGDYRGISLHIVKENFLLNKEDKFAFYHFKADDVPSYARITYIANKLMQDGIMSFKTLKEGYKTPFVGFVIDVPVHNTRYIYMTGTKKWEGGSRQVRVFDSGTFEVDLGDLTEGAVKTIKHTAKIAEILGGLLFGKTEGENNRPEKSSFSPSENLYYPRNMRVYQNHIKASGIKVNDTKGSVDSAQDLLPHVIGLVDGIKKVVNSFELPPASSFKIAGEAYCYTQDGDDYTGMIMHKEVFE